MPLISIVVPVYKVEQHLAQCIESLLAQTTSDIELILVDDGSPDNCGAICDSYASQHPNIKVIHKENQGQTPARKDGLKAATGKYVAFADSDDWVEPDMYEKMIHLLEENGADMVITGYLQEWGDRTESHGNRVPSGIYRGSDLRQLQQRSVFSAEHMGPAISLSLWTKLFRRENIADIFMSIPGELRFGEDALCTWNLLANAHCVVVDNALRPYHYRCWEGSITQRYYADYARDLFYLTDKLDMLYANNGPEMRSAIAHYYISMLLHGVNMESDRKNPKNFFQKITGIGVFCQHPRLAASMERADLTRWPRKNRIKLWLLRHKAPLLFLIFHKGSNLLSRLITR